MWEARRKREEDARARRRKGGERLYRIDLDSEPLLLDEGRWGNARQPDQLEWAERRLDDVGFLRHMDGAVVSYVKELDGFTVLADPERGARACRRSSRAKPTHRPGGGAAPRWR